MMGESGMEMKLSEWQKIRIGEGNKFPERWGDYRQVNWREKNRVKTKQMSQVNSQTT